MPLLSSNQKTAPYCVHRFYPPPPLINLDQSNLVTILIPRFSKGRFSIIFYVHISVHRNIIPNYSQQDTKFLDLFIFTDAVRVSGCFYAHHQEHTTGT
jgi:hypothetical protein